LLVNLEYYISAYDIIIRYLSVLELGTTLNKLVRIIYTLINFSDVVLLKFKI